MPGQKVTITVAAPTAGVVNPDAICDNNFKPNSALKVVITVKNTGKAPWDAASNVIIDATSGTTKACDMSTGTEDGEYTTIMPGRTGTITKQFGVADAKAPLTVSVGALGDVYWTNDETALKAAGR